MAFKKPTLNKTATSITDLSIYIRSVKKWGKSTLARDIIRAKFDGDLTKGVIVECGYEVGDSMLDMNMTHIDTYDDFIEFKDWLISQTGKEHDIKSVCFDTVDELVPIFEAEVVRQYNKKNPTKKVESIKASWGGYNAGVDMAATMIKQYMSEIKKAGFGIFCIGHSRLKTIKEKGSLEEDGYMQLTSTLGNSYESAFGDIFDCTVTGYIDVNYDVKDDKKYITDSVRKLYFRSTSLIDAGCRFANGTVPEYLEYPNSMDSLDFAKLFIKTVEEGLAKSKLTPVTSKPTPKPAPVEPSVPADVSEEEPDDIADLAEQADAEMEIEELRQEVMKAVRGCTDTDLKKTVVTFIKENGGKITELDFDACNRVLEMLS